MLKKIARILYWIVVYTLSITGGYLLGVAASSLEEKIGLIEK